MYKAVIFDLNGVFLQSEFLSKRFADSYHVPEADFVPALKQVMDVVRKPGSPPAFSLWKPYLKEWGTNLSEQEFFHFWFSGEHLVPELVAYSRQLRDRGRQVFILSNNFKERTKYYRQHFPEIFQNVDKAYFSWETGLVKPSPEALELVIRENHLPPSSTIYFDDSKPNLRVAEGLGIRAEIWEGLGKAKAVIEGVLGKEIK